MLVALLLGVLIGGGAMLVANPWLVRRALLENPEILPEAMERLERRETAKALASQRSGLETPFASAWAGAAQGDVTLVAFFDYACGYCRASNPDIDRLLREDDRLKVVWREFPVLGPASEAAARASLAAAAAGRFRAFHTDLFAAGRPTQATIASASAAIGAPPEPEAAEAELRRNFDFARALGINGTPAFVIGDQLLQGAVGYQALREAIAEAREG